MPTFGRYGAAMDRQIRAIFDADTIRVYQAYNDAIADAAVANGTFVSPPFSMNRMTWIKPSFLWMMYRAGWGRKDAGQARILAVDITRAGFESALEQSCLSHFDPSLYANHEEWQRRRDMTSVRVQWDPERDIHANALDHRSLQIGLSGPVVRLYVEDWIRAVTDITAEVRRIKAMIDGGDTSGAMRALPREAVYPLPEAVGRVIGASRQ